MIELFLPDYVLHKTPLDDDMPITTAKKACFLGLF